MTTPMGMPEVRACIEPRLVVQVAPIGNLLGDTLPSLILISILTARGAVTGLGVEIGIGVRFHYQQCSKRSPLVVTCTICCTAPM